MATTTIADLRSKTRTRADMVNSTFVSDTELDEFLTSAWSELYDLLVATFEDYAVSSTSISVVSGTDAYSLPSDFYKARGVDYLNSGAAGDFTPLKRFEWSERGNYTEPNAAGLRAGAESLRYCIRGSQIVFAPVPDGSATVKLWYVPERSSIATSLVVNAGWEEYVVLEAAIQCVLKEDRDVSMLQARKEALRARIVGMAAKRDADAPARMIRRNYDSGEN